ncbi:MAG: PKD domain-containing protein, partial [Mucilaginibacter sp.]
PLNTITSPDAKPVCNDTRVDYNPRAAPGSTFRWSFVAGANAEVVPGPQSGTKITDLIRNNDLAGQDVIVVYTIIPVFDGCDGVPFTFTVTVSPKTISADFTASATEGCGATLLTFTSVSESATSVFNWSVSDGATFTGPIFQHEFQPQDDGSGREKIYAVTLTVINSCAAVPPTKTIEVRISPSTPLPLISAEASGACGLVDITAHNLSPGTNVRYTFSLVDETGNLIQPAKPPVTTKEDQIFTAVQPPLNGTQNVFVKLEVEDKCGTKVSSLSPPIILTPSALVSDVTLDKTFICLGEQVVFTNNSTGTSFAYKVYVKGETVPFITIPVNNRDDLPFEFSSAGDFEVSITPSSGCGPAPESVKKEITVYDVPGAEFTEAVVDCDNLTHQFTVVGPVNPGYNYTWNYGDGSPLVNTPSPAPHTYASSGIYPVTLTVKNVQDCGTTGTPKQVVVNPALIADFSVLPADTIFIPNYHFSFRDQSQGLPVTWAWNFDDKDNSLSTTQNPEFTYTAVDTGYHNITLTITDNNGCPKTIVKVVKITGTPGQLFVPNAFIPTSSSTAIKTFAAKGKGIKAWKMQIYNKWGQLVWQTDKLTSEGEPDEGWDGNYQGQPAPQGAYLWQIEATFVNGTRWKGMSYRNSPPKRTGVINLIR